MSEHKLTICDVCGAVEKKSPSFIGVRDWTIPGVMPFHKRCTDFCSWQCLAAYAAKK